MHAADFYIKRDELIHRVEQERRNDDRALDNTRRTYSEVDYAPALVAIITAVQALNESIENKQHARTVAALELLALGFYNIRLWAATRGISL
jgi:hypothetical protein